MSLGVQSNHKEFSELRSKIKKLIEKTLDQTECTSVCTGDCLYASVCMHNNCMTLWVHRDKIYIVMKSVSKSQTTKRNKIKVTNNWKKQNNQTQRYLCMNENQEN